MATKNRLIPEWVVLPSIALVGFVLWRRFNPGQSFNPLDWISSPNINQTKFHPIGKQTKIRMDNLGDGRYGTSRKDHIHNGIDLVVSAGEAIYSPISGKVIRYSYPYPDDKRYSGVHIQNDEFLLKMWYLSPNLVKPGQVISKGQAIGVAQKISTKYGSGMIDHIHVEVWPNGLGKSVNPTPLFGLA